MQIECINYDKCASKNTTRCEKCEFNKLRNKKADYFKAAKDKPIPEICPKISCETFEEYFSDHTVRHILGYECPVCGKRTAPPARRISDTIDCSHCGYELNI
jgi:predicted RNA-binding Zn-ribbon protein involved in translation (DUF1610 family)